MAKLRQLARYLQVQKYIYVEVRGTYLWIHPCFNSTHKHNTIGIYCDLMFENPNNSVYICSTVSNFVIPIYLIVFIIE